MGEGRRWRSGRDPSGRAPQQLHISPVLRSSESDGPLPDAAQEAAIVL